MLLIGIGFYHRKVGFYYSSDMFFQGVVSVRPRWPGYGATNKKHTINKNNLRVIYLTLKLITYLIINHLIN